MLALLLAASTPARQPESDIQLRFEPGLSEQTLFRRIPCGQRTLVRFTVEPRELMDVTLIVRPASHRDDTMKLTSRALSPVDEHTFRAEAAKWSHRLTASPPHRLLRVRHQSKGGPHAGACHASYVAVGGARSEIEELIVEPIRRSLFRPPRERLRDRPISAVPFVASRSPNEQHSRRCTECGNWGVVDGRCPTCRTILEHAGVRRW